MKDKLASLESQTAMALSMKGACVVYGVWCVVWCVVCGGWWVVCGVVCGERLIGELGVI